MYQFTAFLVFLIAIGNVLVANHSHASGFAVQQQNGAGAGYAYAGAAAVCQARTWGSRIATGSVSGHSINTAITCD